MQSIVPRQIQYACIPVEAESKLSVFEAYGTEIREIDNESYRKDVLDNVAS
jgi:hypothetical protein